MMALHVFRGLFIAMVIAVAWSMVGEIGKQAGLTDLQMRAPWVLMGAVFLGLAVVAVDMLVRRKNLIVFSASLLGVFGGVIIAYGIGLVIDLTVEGVAPDLLRLPVYAEVQAADGVALPGGSASVAAAGLSGTGPTTQPAVLRPVIIGTQAHPLITASKLLIGLVCVYLSISFVLQTQNDIRFIIPYVEFRRQTRGQRPLIVDTSVLVDGRFVELMGTGLVDTPLLVPRFVLAELQALADSADEGRRTRGRRGLEMLGRLQKIATAEVTLYEDQRSGGEDVDTRLQKITRREQGRLLTADTNLARVAAVQGLDVVNVHELAAAMKLAAIPGQGLSVVLARAGERAGQAVGYLDDGTMVVVEHARERVGQTVGVVVTSVSQTSAGRLLFARLAEA